MNSFSQEIEGVLDGVRNDLEGLARLESTKLGALWEHLQESENLLIQLMNEERPGIHTPGNIEMGLVLYWLNNDIPEKYSWLTIALKLLGMPSSDISATELTDWGQKVGAAGVVSGDGTLVSTAKYCQLDPGWIESAVLYVLVRLDVIPKHKFGTTPLTTTVEDADTCTINIIGDWGTGVYKDGTQAACPSQLVMSAADNKASDIAIHLGDVYYTGIASNESTKFTDLWISSAGQNLALNSNHEMYDGAQGYFKVALTSDLFRQQNTSYFSVSFKDWLLVGLDSAYYDTSSLFMEGCITDSKQIKFLNEAGKSQQKIIILTHHCPLNTDGSQTKGLWNDVVSALGREPDYWYFGHMHNGVVYSDQAATGSHTKCRCVGHGAIPYGDGYWLKDQLGKKVEWYTNTPLGSSDPDLALRVKNGYAKIILSQGSLEEAFYDQDGTQAWSATVS